MEGYQDETPSARAWLPSFFQKQTDSKPSSVPHERTALLSESDDGTVTGSIREIEDDGRSKAQLIAAEFWVLLKGSVPVIFAYTLQNSLQTVSVLVVGRLSPEALATAAFSYMFAMATGWLIALGGTTAIDTLGSASFTGSKNKHDLGVILQRSFVVLGLMYIPVAVLWLCSEPVFRALGQEDYISRDSSRFLSVLIPGGLGYIYFECLKKYLQAQGIMRPGTYVLLVTSPLNLVLNYLFVYTFNLGLLGAPFATGISYWLSFFLLLIYARFVSGWDCWGGWSRKCVQNMGMFSRLAILGVIHIGSEWWAFEIVALAAGRLGTIPLAAQSVIMTADQVLNTIPFGLGVATSSRVGNLLGSRNAKGAARAANTAAWLSMLLGGLVLAILMSVKNVFAKAFNDDMDVVRLTAEVMPYVALFQIADGLNGSQGGALRGMGRQATGGTVNLVSYYCGALPLGIYLAFNGWGLAGLWVGQCIALYIVGFGEWIIVAASNWDKQVEKAFARMDEGEQVEAGLGDANQVSGFQEEERR